MKLRVEKWQTTNGKRKEIHFYVKGSVYVFGFNPKFFKKNIADKILKLITMKKPKPIKKPKY